MALDLGRWICMVLEWNLSPNLLQDRPFSAAGQHQSVSQDKHGNMGDSTFSSIKSTGYLRTRGQKALI